MSYFVKIGAIATNKSGVGSRGYQLFRRGRCVVVRWGAVEVIKPRRVYWCYTPQEKEYRFPSDRAAREELQKMTTQRVGREDYDLLPEGAKIKARQV